MDPGSKTDSTNKTKISFVDLRCLRGGECTRTTNSDGKVQTFSYNFFCSIDFLLRKVKKHPCQWCITSPVLDPHLCPGPFSMARATRAARHGPESPGPPGEEVSCGRKWGNDHWAVFQVRPREGRFSEPARTQLGEPQPALPWELPATIGAHEQLSSPCQDQGSLKETTELCEEMHSSLG